MLKLKRVPIDTQREYVAFLSQDCAVYRAEGFKALAKIEVRSDSKHVLATLNVVENGLIVGPDELGLSLQAFKSLGLPEGAEVSIRQASPPESLEAVRAKIRGETLEPQDYKAIIEDVAAHRYSQMELAAFLVSLAGFMTTAEVLALTRAMAGTGTRLSWPDPVVVDKHCVGGLPGNRTSMIVVPIVAAHGLPIPKSSSRAITSPSGTADTMEVLANVDIPLPRLREIVSAERGCLVWGGHMNLAPADDVLISVERPLNVDTPEQMVASILAKKAAAGSTHLLIDIPVGPTAKVRSQSEAIRLRKLFEHVGSAMGMQMVVIISDGTQPIGRGIGPLLEARDVMQVLRREPLAPMDLREKSLELAGMLIEFDPKVKGGQGYTIARDILDSGRALTTMERIIAAQGPSGVPAVLGGFTEDVAAPRTGVVSNIDCARIARVARLAGAPMDKGSGLDLMKRVGDHVTAGEILYRIYAANKSDFAFATALARENSGVELG